MNLEETLQLLTKYRVLRFKGAVDSPHDTVDTNPNGSPRLRIEREVLELELSPLAFMGAIEPAENHRAGAFSDQTGAGMCRCGHALTSHGEHGLCLLGCGDDACELVTDGNGKTTAGP
jgi:hypothetical protein